MPSKLWFICGKVCWKGSLRLDLVSFDDLGSFVRYYKIKMYSTVQFDYYGDDLFKVKVFTTNAVECDYPITKTKEFIKKKKNR